MSTQKDGYSTFFNWFAWSISLGASVFFMIYDVIPSFPGIFSGKEKEMLLFIPWLLIAILGSILSLFKPKSGFILMLIGGIGMSVDLYFRGGWKLAGLMISYSGPYILAALIIGLMRKRA